MVKRIETYKLGTSVHLSDVISEPNPDTVTITIKDSSDIVKIDEATMTKAVSKVYFYIYQSATTDNEGDYVATIEVTKGIYTSLISRAFTLLE